MFVDARLRWAAKGVWMVLFHARAQAGGPPVEVLIDSSAVHALTDASCRPIAFMLTSGNVADCLAGAELLPRLPPGEILHGDKGYDSDAIRRQVESDGAMPNIPPQAKRMCEKTANAN